MFSEIQISAPPEKILKSLVSANGKIKRSVNQGNSKNMGSK